MVSTSIIPAITLWQPWATLIAIKAKPWETRGKPPPKKLIGQRIAIHAAARKMRASDYDDDTFAAMTEVLEEDWPHWFHELPLGVVVCTAILSEARPVEAVYPKDLFGDYRPGRWAWKLDDVVPIDPVPAKGQQLWGWPWKVPPGIQTEGKI